MLIRRRLHTAAHLGLLFFAPETGAGAGAPPPGGAGGGTGQAGEGGNADGAGGGDGAAVGSPAGTDPNGDGQGPAKVEMTQEQIDAMIAKRIGQARKGWEKDLGDYAEAQGQTEAERLTAERDAARRQAEEAVATANQRLVAAEAQTVALDAGANPKRVAALLRLTDLGDVDVSDSGEVDAAALKAAVTKALAEYPEFKADAQHGAQQGSSGGDMNGHGGQRKATTIEDAVAKRLANA